MLEAFSTLLIAVGVIAGLGAVRWVVLPRLSSGMVGLKDRRLVDRLGYPIAFGSGSTWLAVRGVPPERLARALGLDDRRLCGWPEGIESGHAGGIFVAPRIHGWSLVIGSGLRLGRRGDALCALSRRVDAEVQLYTVDPAVARFAWGCADRGRLVRAVEWDAGDVVVEAGEVTLAEREAGLWPLPASRAPDAELDGCLDPEQVIALAARWSLDPRTLGMVEIDVGFGWIASGDGRQWLGLPPALPPSERMAS